MTFEEVVGQRLVLGIEGPRATPEAIELFRRTRAGGLILFRRNAESRAGVRRLLTDLEQALGRRLLVMTDHEGGRVIHLGDGATIFPDAQALGKSGRVEWARRQGEIEGEELRSLGIDLNLAPVLDVLTQAWNPAIGTRSYGEDADLVASLGRARIDGMQSQGLSACAKHFPGLGAAAFDPHDDLPVIRKNLKALRETDLVPFQKAIEGGVDTVMSSHPVYSELDSKPVPATFSRGLIHDLLRLELGFTGVTLTDDLKMGAISKSARLREAVPLAARAGHDLLLICSDPKAQQEAFDALLWAAKQKEIPSSELEASAERIHRLQGKRQERFPKCKVSPEEGKMLAREIARAGAEVLGRGQGGAGHLVAALFPDLSPVAPLFFVEPELLEPHGFLKKIFSKFGTPLHSVEKIPLDPGKGDRKKILETVRDRDLVVFFLADAHRFGGCRELLGELQGSVRRLAVVLLREPHDREWVRPGAACVTAYGFRLCQVEAAIERLFSPA